MKINFLKTLLIASCAYGSLTSTACYAMQITNDTPYELGTVIVSIRPRIQAPHLGGTAENLQPRTTSNLNIFEPTPHALATLAAKMEEHSVGESADVRVYVEFKESDAVVADLKRLSSERGPLMAKAVEYSPFGPSYVFKTTLHPGAIEALNTNKFLMHIGMKGIHFAEEGASRTFFLKGFNPFKK